MSSINLQIERRSFEYACSLTPVRRFVKSKTSWAEKVRIFLTLKLQKTEYVVVPVTKRSLAGDKYMVTNCVEAEVDVHAFMGRVVTTVFGHGG
jgi:hypothetical protein